MQFLLNINHPKRHLQLHTGLQCEHFGVSAAQKPATLTKAMWLLFQVLLSTRVVRLAIPAI